MRKTGIVRTKDHAFEPDEEMPLHNENKLLRMSSCSNILSWVILLLYSIEFLAGVTPAVHVTWFTTLFSESLLSNKFLDILGWVIFLSPYLEKLVTGIMFFLFLQALSEGILMLIDIEENSKRVKNVT